jgi:hypothetical protein
VVVLLVVVVLFVAVVASVFVDEPRPAIRSNISVAETHQTAATKELSAVVPIPVVAGAARVCRRLRRLVASRPTAGGHAVADVSVSLRL